MARSWSWSTFALRATVDNLRLRSRAEVGLPTIARSDGRRSTFALRATVDNLRVACQPSTFALRATVDNLRVACQPSTFALRAMVDNLRVACQPKLAPSGSASKRRLVDDTRLELVTSALRTRRSPN
jgi:hypothetical protein